MIVTSVVIKMATKKKKTYPAGLSGPVVTGQVSVPVAPGRVQRVVAQPPQRVQPVVKVVKDVEILLPSAEKRQFGILLRWAAV